MSVGTNSFEKEITMKTTLATVLGMFLFASTCFGTTCSAGTNINISETVEALGAFTCDLPPGFTFGANAGTAVIFDPGGVLPSDIITLTDVHGALSTVTFLSDGELPLPLPSIINFSVVEPKPFVTLALSTSGSGGLRFTFSSDVLEGNPSENISVGAVPEPATLTLLSIGLLGVAERKRRRLS
jgi:PEP-CTERM motif